MMRFLRLSSLLIALLVAGCGAPYKGLQRVDRPGESAFRFKPVFDKEVYRCHVDGRFLFKKFHLSGILFFKNLDDSSTRVVFQNEMGYSFFDFGWDQYDSFRVFSVIPQLNKKAVMKTLRKDIELLLMRNLDSASEQIFTKTGVLFYRFQLSKGYAYYVSRDPIARAGDGGLLDIVAANRHPVTRIELILKKNYSAMPRAITIHHYRAHFTIDAKKIDSTNVE